MAYYVFRINYNEHFELLRNELLNEKRLRQGWGTFDMQLDAGEDSFIMAWEKHWGNATPEGDRRARYKKLRNMMNIQPGDYIIIPKLNLQEKYVCQSFTVVRCKEAYKFSVLEKVNDFGHYIVVDEMFSCRYDWNDDTNKVKRMFTTYRSPIVKSHNDNFIQAVDNLIKINSEEPQRFKNENRDLISTVTQATHDQRNIYLEYIVKSLGAYGNSEFEDIIEMLFIKNGYVCTRRNHYDKKGGDVDIILESCNNNSLMHTIYSLSEVSIPQLFIQAKKKTGIDYDDIKGVEQLIQIKNSMESKNTILMLISLVDKFTTETIAMARENDIILIDGMTFASLLVRYGIEVELV